VGFLVASDGSVPTKDFLTTLKNTKRGSRKAADITAKLTYLSAAVSLGRNFKAWEPPILQLTCEPYRVMCVEREIGGQRYLVLLHIFEKHNHYTPKADEQRTRTIYGDFDERTQS